MPVPAPQPVPSPPSGTISPDAWAPPVQWAAPVGEPAVGTPPLGTPTGAAPRRRVPTAVKGLLIGTLTLALAITATWVAGGFERREALVPAEVDEPLDLGPVTITLHRALARPGTVDVAATCELTADTADSLTGYAVGDAAISAIRVDDVATNSDYTSFEFGVETTDTLGSQTRDTMSPGLGPMPCVLGFSYPLGEYGDKIIIGINRLEYVDLSNVKTESSENRNWESSPNGYVVEMPLTQAR